MARQRREQTASEELANSLTHGVGLALSIACLVLLVVFAALKGSTWHVVSGSIYGSTLVILYLSSTLYHSVRHPGAKHVFNILDHSAIYLLVAGTYTPYTLGPLRGHGGWLLFGMIWGLALLGVVFQSCFLHRYRAVSLASYIAMGWAVVFAINPLIAYLPRPGVIWLAAGGLCYTGGVLFYARKQPFSHAIWHLCVLAGSLCHFFSIFLYVVVKA